MSTEHPTNSKNSEDSVSPIVSLPHKDTYTLAEFRTSQVFFFIITFGVFVLIVGGIWAIGDIFSETKFEIFLGLSLFSQIFIVGLIIVLIFVLSIFMVVFYRRGRDAILRTLFKQKPKDKDVEEYVPAKIISAGALLSIFFIIVGLLIALIQLLAGGGDTSSGFWSFLGQLTGGLITLMIGGIMEVFILLVLVAVFAWQNGYYYVMNNILRYNKKISFAVEFSPRQKIAARVFFIVVVVALITILFGIVYAVLDAVMPTGKWQEFAAYPIGIQISLISVSAAVLFLLLIGAMTLYRWGNVMISLALFARLEPAGTHKDNKAAQVIAWGILIGIFLIAFSLIIWLFSLWFNAFGQDISNPFVALMNLSGGLLMLSIGIIIMVFTFLILAFAYVFNNGYFLIVKRIMETQDKVNRSIDTTPKIIKPEKKKTEKKKPEKKK
jgi:hypothetical protein